MTAGERVFYKQKRTGGMHSLIISICQKWFVPIKNIQLKSRITSFFKWKPSKYSGFSYFTLMCLFRIYLWKLCPIACKKSHIDIPHSASVVAAQLTCPFALVYRRRWHEVPAGIRKCILWQVISKHSLTPRPTHHIIMYSEILKTNIRTLAPE